MADETKRTKRSKKRRSGEGYFETDATSSGYENLIGTCRLCEKRLIVNRATDLDYQYPAVGAKFHCLNCGKVLRIGGDVANHPVTQFVFDAYGPLLQRRYMQCVLMISQALELGLVMCASARIFGKLRKPKRIRIGSPFNQLHLEFSAAVDKLTLEALRRVVARLAVRRIEPTTVVEARAIVAEFKKMTSPLKDEEIALIQDGEMREAVAKLVGTDFVKFRNSVVHNAYPPTQEQAEYCYEVVPNLNRKLMELYGVTSQGGQLVMPPRAGLSSL